jgi:hypothetical protein
MTSLGHQAFLATLRKAERGGTPNERRLAGLLRELYEMTADQPAVAAWLTRWSSQVMESGDDQ